jgi:hypothetical protein
MADNELMVKSGDIVPVIEQSGIGSVLKPLTTEIHLFDTFVAGTTHLKDAAVLETLRVGEKLSLQREDNKFDSNAILIFNDNKEKIGYVPEKDNVIFARLMDAGKMLKAKISKIDKKGSFYQITIGIYLVDY